MKMPDLLPLPLEQLTGLPELQHLDGSQGENRELAKKCLISAIHDVQAIHCWLAEYKKSDCTYRNYRKDAERLLLWAIIEKNKALSSLTAEDLLKYSRFLEDPQPREKWCGVKRGRDGKRLTTHWRPFVAGLKPTAKAVAFRNIGSLFNYLTDNQYLNHNPMLPVRRQLKDIYIGQDDKDRVQKRIIDTDEWTAILAVSEQMPDRTIEEKFEKARIKFLLGLGYFAALRIHEIETHTMGAFYKQYDRRAGKNRWWLRIVGKGSKVREIPVNADLLAALFDYRATLNLPLEPQLGENEPLLRAWQTGKNITARRINQLIKEITKKAAQLFELNQPEKAVRLKQFSAHWLRHLSCSMQGLVNMNKQNIKENAGHENDSTTDIYLHAFDNLRHEEMNKLTWQPITN